MRYAIRLSTDDNGSLLVRVPDVPEAITFGATKEEAQDRAVEAILSVLDECIRAGRPIPVARTTGDTFVEIRTPTPRR